MGAQSVQDMFIDSSAITSEPHTSYDYTSVGILDVFTQHPVAFTCLKCKVAPKPRKYDIVDTFYRCKQCNAAKYRWLQKKTLPEKIIKQIQNKRNCMLITFTTPNLAVLPEDIFAVKHELRLDLNKLMRKLCRSRISRGVEYSWWRKNIKSWFYAFEVTAKPHIIPDFPNEDSGMVSLNGHIHCLVEREQFFSHQDIKEFAIANGFGPVTNLRWINPSLKGGILPAVRYIVKYIVKDHKTRGLRRRYYERGGNFRKNSKND